MTCPHLGAHPKPAGLPESAKATCDKVPLSPSEKEMIKRATKFNFQGIECLNNIFPKKVYNRGIGKLKYPNDPEEAEEYRIEFPKLWESIDTQLRGVVMNISEYERYSSRGPGCRLAELLNAVGLAMCEKLAIPTSSLPRGFNCRFGIESACKKISDLDRERKPDIVLVDRNHVDIEVSWACVHCPIVVFENRSYLNSALVRLLGFAHHIINCQARNFVIGVAFFGTHFVLTVFSRSGVYVTCAYRCREVALEHLLAGLLFAEEWSLGYDPSFTWRDGSQYLCINGLEYLVKEHFSNHLIRWNIFDSGSVVRVVERHGKKFVNKDIWIDPKRDTDEPLLLERVRGVKGVVQLENHEFLKYPDGEIVSTQIYEEWLKNDNRSAEEISRHVELNHHQLIISPYGDGLSTFTSLEELVSAMRDIARAIKQLDRRRIYHADVSEGNIVLAPASDYPDGPRRGHLIDFGISIVGQPRQGVRPGGTSVFMALEPMLATCMANKTHYRARHDLESLFYVLCYVCTNLAGPNRSYVTTVDEGGIRNRWLAQGTASTDAYRKAFSEKYTDVIDEKMFEKRVIANFQPYFHDLIPCARELRKMLCWPTFFHSRGRSLDPHHDDLALDFEFLTRRKLGVTLVDQEHAWETGFNVVFIDSVLQVWDKTLAMLRRKAGKPETLEDDDEDEDEEEKVVVLPDAKVDAKKAEVDAEKAEDGDKDAGDVPEASQDTKSESSEDNESTDGKSERVVQEGKEDFTGPSEAAVAVSPDHDTPLSETDKEVTETDALVDTAESKTTPEPTDMQVVHDQVEVPKSEEKKQLPAAVGSKRKRDSDSGSTDSGYVSGPKEVAAESKRQKVDADVEDLDRDT